MGHVYGLVLAAIVPVYILVVSFIIFLKRNHPFLKSRKPDFILIQNFGVMFNILLCSLYIGLRPSYSCKLILLSSTLNISLIGLIMLVRTCEYCIKFHVALLQARFRFNEFAPTWSEPSWIYRNLWIANHSFIRKILLALAVLWTFPVFVYFAPYLIPPYEKQKQKLTFQIQIKLPYEEASLTCPLPTGWTWVYCSIAAIIISILVAFLIRNSRDAYRIRHEKFALGCVWAFVYIFMFTYPTIVTHETMRVIPPTFFHLIGLIGTACISNLLPLYYVYKVDSKDRNVGSYEQFLSLLQCPAFRNEFYKFLTEQFCGENLQFYETVQAWKAMDPTDEKKRTNAQLIYDHFVKDDGLCQVDIAGEIKAVITEEMTKTDIPEDTFDEAYNALLHDMYSNSFVNFQGTRAFAESTTIELV